MTAAFRTCLVTDRRALGADWIAELPALAGRAAEAGIDLVQVRERGLGGRALAHVVRACREQVRGSATRLLVNDRLDVALGEGADGVHLPGHGLRPSEVRPSVPPGFLIGRSVHPGDLDPHNVQGADFAIFGTVFPSASKPGVPGCGLEALARAVRLLGLPVLAIGGVDGSRLSGLAGTGAAGVAAIGWFGTPSVEDLRQRVRLVHDAFDTLGRQLP